MKSEGSQIIRKEKGEDSKIIIIMEKKKKIEEAETARAEPWGRRF